ncbi:MAG: hypothetical protein OXF08_10735 [Bacteroidetes bacterium]|nr:hypothetical protein [Bacteroidota bacterium]
MVSVDYPNLYELREYAKKKVICGIDSDPLKLCFVRFLELDNIPSVHIDVENLTLYQKCSVASLQFSHISKSDLYRLFGRAPRIDQTPMPWVSDVIGVMTIKWFVDQYEDDKMKEMYKSWISKFLCRESNSVKLNNFEQDIVQYIQESDMNHCATSTIPLFLHYNGKQIISDQNELRILISKFFIEFKEQVLSKVSPLIIAMMIYCFDYINRTQPVVPPKNWSLNDLSLFLNHIPDGLRRWTWEEEKGRTRNSKPVKWLIENEYHVQNILYVLLAPIFNDIVDEINLPNIGQKNPRADLYLPSLDTMIEVKYRKNSKKSFPMLIGEIAEDSGLYLADSKYENAKLVCFLWDHTRSTQEHTIFREGVLKLSGIQECIVICSPSFM